EDAAAGTQDTPAARGPLVSDDGRAAVITTEIEVAAGNTETAEVVAGPRGEVSETLAGAGAVAHVVGGPAAAAGLGARGDGAARALLAVTIAIVAVLLIVTYRSPVLWLVPLVVVAVADRAASILTNLAGEAFDLQFDAGIISVLVFGAGTNYALLLISRY